MKFNTAKRFCLTLAAALTLTALTACASSAAPQDTAPSDSPQSVPVSVGTVLLSVNPEIEMSYDDRGNVVALTGLNDDGRAVLSAYTGYEGKACTDVVRELVEQIDAGGYFDATIGGHEKNIVLKLERGSQAPSDRFLDSLADAVRTAVESGHIGSQAVALDEDDLDDTYGDRDYINAAAAQDLLSAQLGRDDLQFVEKDYDLDDGEYEVEFVLDGVEYAYEVNALTGKITEMEIDIPEQDDDRDDGIVDDRDDNWDDGQDDDWDDGRDDNWDDGRDDDWDDGQDDNWDDGRDDDWDDGQDDDWDDGQDDDWDDGQDDDWDDGQDDDWDDGQDDDWDDGQDDDWDDGQDDDWDGDWDDNWDDDWDDDWDD